MFFKSFTILTQPNGLNSEISNTQNITQELSLENCKKLNEIGKHFGELHYENRRASYKFVAIGTVWVHRLPHYFFGSFNPRKVFN